MSLLSGPTRAQKQGLKWPTCKKYSQDWARWKSYIVRLGIPDVYLQTLSRNQKMHLLQAFIKISAPR
eukprot:966696-Ditylum_brightwellii.AAC.1